MCTIAGCVLKINVATVPIQGAQPDITQCLDVFVEILLHTVATVSSITYVFFEWYYYIFMKKQYHLDGINITYSVINFAFSKIQILFVLVFQRNKVQFIIQKSLFIPFNSNAYESSFESSPTVFSKTNNMADVIVVNRQIQQIKKVISPKLGYVAQTHFVSSLYRIYSMK